MKALQDVDFTKTGEQIKAMNDFYSKVNEAMSNIAESVDETVAYKDQVASLNKNLSSLNGVYGNVLNALTGGGNAYS